MWKGRLVLVRDVDASLGVGDVRVVAVMRLDPRGIVDPDIWQLRRE